MTCLDFSGGSHGKVSVYQCGRPGFNPWVGKIPWRRKWQPTPVLLPRKSHGRRSLVQVTVHGVSKSRTHWEISLHNMLQFYLVQFSSVAQSSPTLCNPMNRSTPGLPVHHQLPGFTQTHVHRVGDAIQPSHPLSSPFPPAFNLSQYQGLLQSASSLHQVAKVLELQLQHQSF